MKVNIYNIAGFTEGGVPYGIFKEEMEEYDEDELDEIMILMMK